MPPTPDILHRISLGGKAGRRAFLDLWLKALKSGDTIEIDRLSHIIDNEWNKQDAAGQTHWPKHDRNIMMLILEETLRATRRRAYCETTLSQETMTSIVTGGESGRRAFVSL